MQPALTKGLTAHDCGGPQLVEATLPSHKSGNVLVPSSG